MPRRTNNAPPSLKTPSGVGISELLDALRKYAKRHDPESRMSHLRMFDDGSGCVYRNRLDDEGTGFRDAKDALKVMRS